MRSHLCPQRHICNIFLASTGRVSLHFTHTMTSHTQSHKRHRHECHVLPLISATCEHLRAARKECRTYLTHSAHQSSMHAFPSRSSHQRHTTCRPKVPSRHAAHLVPQIHAKQQVKPSSCLASSPPQPDSQQHQQHLDVAVVKIAPLPLLRDECVTH